MPSQTNLFAQKVSPRPKGYYSGDRLNPNLQAFVEAHLEENPYDPETDDYDVPAFDKPINTTKATAIYNMHTYWSKKPHSAIRQYIQHYTKPGDLVLDPFCGSGGTALAALMDGRKAIAIDRSPAATFITKNYCTPVSINEFQAAFDELQRKVKQDVGWLYETKCERCEGKATTAYTVYSQVFQCTKCLSKVPLFDCIETQGKTKSGKSKKIKTCPHCYEKGYTEEISTRSDKFGSVPVLVSYICKCGCKPKRDQRRHNDVNSEKAKFFKEHDLENIKEAENKAISYWYPKVPMIEGRETCIKRNLKSQGVYLVSDLYTKRSLWTLSAIKKNIEELTANSNIKDALLFAMQGILLINSKMCRAETTQTQNGTYYLPQVFKELFPLNSVKSKVDVISEAYQEYALQSTDINISTDSACNLTSVVSNSVDYIFTDPPYGDKVQYGELNFVWEAWMDYALNWHDEEIVINQIRGKTEADWADSMRQAMAECFRVLKPGRWLSLCYHDTSEGTWSLIQDIMAEVGFVVDKTSKEALFIDTGQKSYNQTIADKVTKRDLVINFRKPKPGEVAQDIALTGEEGSTTFNDKVRTIIRDYLSVNPGSTKDRIYDELVSRMVRSGQMEAHNFSRALFAACGTKVFFNPKDRETAHEFSGYLGEKEVRLFTRSRSHGRYGGQSRSEQVQRVPLMTADQILKLKQGECVFINPGYQGRGEASVPLRVKVQLSKRERWVQDRSTELWHSIVKQKLTQRCQQQTPPTDLDDENTTRKTLAEQLFFLPVPGVNTDTGELPHIDPDLTEDEFEEAMT